MVLWIVAAIAGIVLVAGLVFLLSRREEGAVAAGGTSSPSPSTGARDGNGTARTREGTGEAGGTKLASDRPPPSHSPAHLVHAPPAHHPPAAAASNAASTEIDVSGTGFDVDFEEDEPSGPQPRILVSAAGQTDAGRRRKHNEDAYLVLANHSLFAIADGMGGYAAGEVASQMAIDVITAAFETGHFGGAPISGLPRRGDELVRAIQTANQSILQQARTNEAQAGMGTTVVAARFSPNRKRVYIAHVGDSRLYRIRGDQLQQLTTDHTLGAMGIAGPSANKLSRAVGVFDEVEVDLNVDEPEVGDYYMLCSDGLSKMVSEDVMKQIVVAQKGDIDGAVNKLIAEANERGGKDNVSVILIRVDSPGR